MSKSERPNLSPQKAREAINTLVGGEPPSLDILESISVGLQKDLATFEREYFQTDSFVVADETQGSTFKIVEAYYGGGKTHYLRSVEALAHRYNFVSAFVGLKKDACPLTHFERVFGTVMVGLTAQRRTLGSRVHGVGDIIRSWVDDSIPDSENRFADAHRLVDEIGDIPLIGIKVALRSAVMAHVTGDKPAMDEALTYLTSGSIPTTLRKQGVLQRIDSKNGSLALRSVAHLVKSMGFAGFLLVLDEGDRSLSISSTKERKAASNNLVQLINETASEGAWPSSLLLYSIPSWLSFKTAFQDNDALIQRVDKTGFPLIPPAPRIQLDDRQRTDEERTAFCLELAQRLDSLFFDAYPNFDPDSQELREAASSVTRHVVHNELNSTFRRLFVQSYLSSLFTVMDGSFSNSVAEAIVTRQLGKLDP